MRIAIRPARAGDHAALCALFDELDEFHRQARPDFFRRFDGPARTNEQISAWRAGPDSTVLVAEEAPDLVGLVVLLPRSPSSFAGAVPRKVIVIDNLVVTADRRSRGVGRQLLDAALRWAQAQGASHVELGVHAVNREARRFYERSGFEVSVNWMARAVSE